MTKRIAVFAALVLGYVLTGMALNASQPADAASPVSPAAAQTESN
ncbi:MULTISPECIES: hypothetical protein [Xanthobacter]|uniref:Uncharacterized protein n=1 Tax=Xanthobacter flavus TaxID=281 RepID=A0A9W6CLM1_XANFL|nr:MULTISPECIES: hypothetical protein [Xanthobacter]MDR6335651.1 hypothetical protein [Xanthobacter flavus]NMN59769.1 hypothetical protein [Xanthobacter sp. SG618]GLI24673.1 hypothetical protein XFLAVUS301_43470 [Xanthobacter flavus]